MCRARASGGASARFPGTGGTVVGVSWPGCLLTGPRRIATDGNAAGFRAGPGPDAIVRGCRPGAHYSHAIGHARRTVRAHPHAHARDVHACRGRGARPWSNWHPEIRTASGRTDCWPAWVPAAWGRSIWPAPTAGARSRSSWSGGNWPSRRSSAAGSGTRSRPPAGWAGPGRLRCWTRTPRRRCRGWRRAMSPGRRSTRWSPEGRAVRRTDRCPSTRCAPSPPDWPGLSRTSTARGSCTAT